MSQETRSNPVTEYTYRPWWVVLQATAWTTVGRSLKSQGKLSFRCLASDQTSKLKHGVDGSARNHQRPPTRVRSKRRMDDCDSWGSSQKVGGGYRVVNWKEYQRMWLHLLQCSISSPANRWFDNNELNYSHFHFWGQNGGPISCLRPLEWSGIGTLEETETTPLDLTLSEICLQESVCWMTEEIV